MKTYLFVCVVLYLLCDLVQPISSNPLLSGDIDYKGILVRNNSKIKTANGSLQNTNYEKIMEKVKDDIPTLHPVKSTTTNTSTNSNQHISTVIQNILEHGPGNDFNSADALFNPSTEIHFKGIEIMSEAATREKADKFGDSYHLDNINIDSSFDTNVSIDGLESKNCEAASERLEKWHVSRDGKSCKSLVKNRSQKALKAFCSLCTDTMENLQSALRINKCTMLASYKQTELLRLSACVTDITKDDHRYCYSDFITTLQILSTSTEHPINLSTRSFRCFYKTLQLYELYGTDNSLVTGLAEVGIQQNSNLCYSKFLKSAKIASIKSRVEYMCQDRCAAKIYAKLSALLFLGTDTHPENNLSIENKKDTINEKQQMYEQLVRHMCDVNTKQNNEFCLTSFGVEFWQHSHCQDLITGKTTICSSKCYLEAKQKINEMRQCLQAIDSVIMLFKGEYDYKTIAKQCHINVKKDKNVMGSQKSFIKLNLGYYVPISQSQSIQLLQKHEAALRDALTNDIADNIGISYKDMVLVEFKIITPKQLLTSMEIEINIKFDIYDRLGSNLNIDLLLNDFEHLLTSENISLMRANSILISDDTVVESVNRLPLRTLS